MNSSILIGITALALGASASAQAGNNRYERDRDDRNPGYARVLDVQPMVERVRYSVPVEQCWDEEQVQRGGYRKDPTGAILGGALGAIVGSNIGQGGNRGIATVGGALVGAAIGNEVAGDKRYYRGRREVVQHCETRHEERWDERVVAYRVTYVYNGRRDVTRLSYEPGRYFRLADARRFG